MKYAVEVVSGAMIYIPSFIKTGSGIQKLLWAGYIHRQQSEFISLLLFFNNKESRLKYFYKHRELKLNSVAFSLQANYTDQPTATCRRS
jgi:hypothetical protein